MTDPKDHNPDPSGDRTHHRRVSDVLASALDRPETDRVPFVRDACAGEPAVLRDVLELLGADSEAHGFLDGTPVVDVDDLDVLVSGQGLPEIAGFRVLRRIGEGGMGSVFEAEQATPRRRVAIKVLRGLERSREALRRFRFESEVLARLRHPGIAQIYEAGTYTDAAGGERPYFAMEYVEDSTPISVYADRSGLDAHARAGLFVDVCNAVHAGHQRGVIHRDLKPGNILVDNAGRVKIIDYGVARVTAGDSLAPSLEARTIAGGLVGTVRYMSPEQVGGDPDAIDARTDVYALGVVLYELLTGRAPYDLARTSVANAARIIESQEPARPSSVDRDLRGDAEAILLRALEKDPDARYASASAFAADLERWLGDRPVEARAGTTVYLLRKFARRHRGATAAALVAAGSPVVATGFSTAMAVRATRAATAEREQRESLEDLNAYLAGVLTSVTPEATRSRDVTVREMLGDAVARIETELGDRPLLGATLRHKIGESYLAVGAATEAEAVLLAALKTRSGLLGDHPETMATLVRLGDARLELGRPGEALDGFGRAIEMANRLGVRGATPVAIEAMGGLGIATAMTGDLGEGGAILRSAIDEARSAGVSDEQRLTLMNTYATLRTRAGEHEDAIAMMRDVVDERTSLLGADHPSTLTSVNNLGTAFTDARRYEEAEAVLRANLDDRTRVLGVDHPETLSSMNNLAIALSRLGRTDEAGVLTRRVLERRIAVLGRTHADTITAAMNLYGHLDRTDLDAEADALLAEYVPIAERTLDAAHPIRLFVLSKFVLSGLRNERYGEAADAARRALVALDGVEDESYWEVGRFRAMLGAALSAGGSLDEGGAMLEQGLAGLEAARGSDHPWTRWARARLADHRTRLEASATLDSD